MHGKGAFYREWHWEPGGNGSAYLTGLTNAVFAAMEAKRQKLSFAFTKYLSIANPANGASFLMEVDFCISNSYHLLLKRFVGIEWSLIAYPVVSL